MSAQTASSIRFRRGCQSDSSKIFQMTLKERYPAINNPTLLRVNGCLSEAMWGNFSAAAFNSGHPQYQTSAGFLVSQAWYCKQRLTAQDASIMHALSASASS